MFNGNHKNNKQRSNFEHFLHIHSIFTYLRFPLLYTYIPTIILVFLLVKLSDHFLGKHCNKPVEFTGTKNVVTFLST